MEQKLLAHQARHSVKICLYYNTALQSFICIIFNTTYNHNKVRKLTRSFGLLENEDFCFVNMYTHFLKVLAVIVIVTIWCCDGQSFGVRGAGIGGGARSRRLVQGGQRAGLNNRANLDDLQRRQAILDARRLKKARGNQRARLSNGGRFGQRNNVNAAQFNNKQLHDNLDVQYNKKHHNKFQVAINAEQAHSENFALRKNQGVNLNSGAKLAANNDILAEHHNHLDAANDHEILAQDQLGVGAVRDDRFRLGQNFHGLNDNFFTASDDEIFGHSGFSNNGFPNTNFGRKLFKK
ncbi:hypothetical protein EB796_012763 [Bugula neritina]|uniref:Uncharacterized protein n=1 Tax=Bugula neritina TaxID=10212 RepID=A0A7J7JTG2_BUGNE|nr:hypothetical protein EB796_012763 [Bugula neritina]